MAELKNGVWRRKPIETPERWKRTAGEGGMWELHLDPDGEWFYQTSIFSQAPWETFHGGPNVGREQDQVPSLFVQIFGPRPDSAERAKTGRWENELAMFAGAALIDSLLQATADDIYAYYEMGKPVAYKIVKGDVLVAFPDSQLTGLDDGFRTSAQMAYGFEDFKAGYVVAVYQARLKQRGIQIPEGKLHPLLGPIRGHTG